MWIVRLALRRPYTVAVMSLLILVMGVLSLSRMIVDIFPIIDIPVVIVVWNYPGLSPEDMERRVVLISERAYSTTVNGIQRIESQSTPGIGLLKVYFQPGTEIGAAISQIASVSSTLLRIAPPGIQPPNIVQFNASNVPVAQLTVSSKTLPEEQIFDYGLNFIRVRLFTIPGLSTPAPFGGKNRQIMVDVDPSALAARGLSPQDVVTALQTSNVIIPAGTTRIGGTEYNVLLNSSPRILEEFNAIPVKVVGTAPVYLGDIAKVSDSYAQQTNIVRVNGKRATYLAILKHADASTLAVVDAAREALPQIKEVAPEGLELKIDFDQSVFVRAAIEGVVREAVLAAILVSLMILMFLGSWRSMVVVSTSIPLSIFTAVIALNLAGSSINIMTLGGLALAIGMLVDDATVEVENIHRNRALAKPLTVAILDSASQVAVPAIVATLSICVVFFPVVLLEGPAKFLFTPLAFSVVTAMLASYLLSRTLVPTLSRMLMTGEHHSEPEKPRGRIARVADRLNQRREAAFERFQNRYARMLDAVLAHRTFTLATGVIILLLSAGLLFVVGMDFFPSVDAGLMKLHFRAPTGTRIEDTEKIVEQVEKRIRDVIPADEIDTINDMIGVPIFFNLAFVQTDNIAGMDTDILIALKRNHRPTALYRQKLREVLTRDFPGSSFYFQPADIVSQVLNFGLSSPIDVQIEDMDFMRSYHFARQMRDAMSQIPGLADVHISQVLDYPALQVDVDRVRAANLGMSQRDVANSVLISLSSSSLISPSFFLNPVNNVNYTVAVQIPPRQIESVGSLQSIPITALSALELQQPITPILPTQTPQLNTETLANLATVYHRATPENINHYTVQRVLNVGASVEGRDLGSVARDIQQKIRDLGSLPPGTRIILRGQNEVMNQSFRSLGMGLILAIILVYFLMVTLFQSWLDPFIIMMAIPGALVGILWMLALTGTTINVESLMGSIMAVGIATSNSILLVNFANDFRLERDVSPHDAVLQAGKTRLRPVIMTALAMILGMLPMAVGLGEGGEQNAPLGRAVIGGLIVATVVTLFMVPVFYTLLRTSLPTKHLLEERFRAEERGEVFEGNPK
ncbi:MAG TPA: efflux RND transporter permease subunit [Desulfomonilaceae bacterium]|nr:efflux RND transporter permease subunit [Desulfomonilaceae bacterium]